MSPSTIPEFESAAAAAADPEARRAVVQAAQEAKFSSDVLAARLATLDNVLLRCVMSREAAGFWREVQESPLS